MPKLVIRKLLPMELISYPNRKIAALARPKIFKHKYPAQRLPNNAAVRAEVNKWKKAQKVTALPRPKEMRFKAVKYMTQDLTRFRKVHESKIPHAEAVNQMFKPADLLGHLFSVVTTYEYMKLRSEYRQRLRAAPTPAQKKDVQRQWKKHVQAIQTIFARARLPRLTTSDIDRLAGNLSRDKRNFDAVKKIYGTASSITSAEQVVAFAPVGIFQAVATELVLPGDLVTSIADLCEILITGTYTKYISETISWNVRLKVWCPKWNDPFRTCWKTFSIARVSFTLGVDVSYKVDCHGFSAWGCSYAEACASVLGQRICASCQGCVTAADAVGRSTGSGNCLYGNGVKIEVICRFAGITIFYAVVSFDLEIEAPCV